MKTQPQELRVEQVPVGLIRPSPANPRKHYDQGALGELAASIQAVGVQVPLSLRLVGRKDMGYEIVGGERRWRAAQIAGLASVPAIVRVMGDAECREAQLIDNLQRADLSPMEEAEGYEALIREAGEAGFSITDEQLAAKVGKPVGYVRSRRKLLELIPEARAALAEGFLTFGCALLIAKLQPADQDKGLIYALRAERRKIEEARKAYVEREWPLRRAIYVEIRKKLTGAKLLRAVVADLLDHGSFEELAALRGLDGTKGGDWNAARKVVTAAFAKAKDVELEGWLVDVVAARSVAPSPYLYADVKRDRSKLWELGKLLGVDCDAILKRMEAAKQPKKATAPVAKAKPGPAVKKAPAKPAKKAAAQKKAVRK